LEKRNRFIPVIIFIHEQENNSVIVLNFAYKFSNDGISAWQGGHHEAQKLMNSTFPFKSAVVVVLPVASVNENEAAFDKLLLVFLLILLSINQLKPLVSVPMILPPD
jgi:hypothetical protein